MSYGWCPTREWYVHLDAAGNPDDPETCWICHAPEQDDTNVLPCRDHVDVPVHPITS